MDYTPQEIMVAAAAREIRDGEIVFTGMRLPLIAFALAKQMHAPNAVGLFECGLMRDTPAPELLYTMGDPPNIAGALWATRMINIMGLLQRGAVDLGFIGGAELDRFGNLNTSCLGNPELPKTKLPGSGGAADIAGLSKRFVVIMAHEKRRLVERVDYITSPGFGDGKGWRERVGLRHGGPSAIITTLCVLGFESSMGEAVLRSYHPGQSVASVRAETGWDLHVAEDVQETESPTAEELTIIRRYDPQGFWTR
ncbi:MAG: CoA-transferase [Proteobacteria bacterium]|nr:CoA-transferase [Pseudomonadota bacterium]